MVTRTTIKVISIVMWAVGMGIFVGLVGTDDYYSMYLRQPHAWNWTWTFRAIYLMMPYLVITIRDVLTGDDL